MSVQAAPRLTRQPTPADSTFKYLCVGAGVLVLVVLGLIAYTMTTRSWDAISTMGLSFFTDKKWDIANEHYGALSYIFGTLYSATIAIVLAVPLSLGIALFTTQVAPPWLKRPITYLVDLLAVVPSVIWGLWGALVLANPIRTLFNHIHDAVGGVPILRTIFGPAQGKSFATAGVILAAMIVPIITSLSREVMETVPPTDREGALALGATRWEMIKGTVLPHSRTGIVGAVMLGLGRAMGETIAAALVIGGAAQLSANAFASGDSLPAVIANQWSEAGTLQKSALIGLAMTLFVITLIVNLIANYVVNRADRRRAI
jgi:phosphate transport system permease protein